MEAFQDAANVQFRTSPFLQEREVRTATCSSHKLLAIQRGCPAARRTAFLSQVDIILSFTWNSSICTRSPSAEVHLFPAFELTSYLSSLPAKFELQITHRPRTQLLLLSSITQHLTATKPHQRPPIYSRKSHNVFHFHSSTAQDARRSLPVLRRTAKGTTSFTHTLLLVVKPTDAGIRSTTPGSPKSWASRTAPRPRPAGAR